MADEEDIFATMGGSLLNDLLSDLDKTSTDDLFTSLEQELATSYGNSTTTTSGSTKTTPSAPPGLGSAAAFVVNQPSYQSTTTVSTSSSLPPITNPEDAWSAALGQFGGMSLAADFLAADTAKKNQQGASTATTNNVSSNAGADVGLVQTDSGILAGEAISNNVVDSLFEDEEEYKLEEDVKIIDRSKKVDQSEDNNNDDDGIDETGGLMALLGAASSRGSKKTSSATVVEEEKGQQSKNEQVESTEVGVLLSPKQPSQQPPTLPITTPDKSGTMAPPPSPMFPPPFPPGVMPPPNMMHPHHPPPPPNMMHPPPPHHPGMMMPPHPGMMMMPPPPPNMQGMPPPPNMMMPQLAMQQQQGMMMGRPPPGVLPTPPTPSSSTTTNKATRKFNKDFPALGDEPEEKSQDDDNDDEEEEEQVPPTTPLPPRPTPNTNIRILFNNADPSAPSIPAKSISTPLMPQRDLCYIIHSMLRPLQSLDTYNDDYYHWSFVDRKSRNLLLLGGGPSSNPGVGGIAQPNPVWKEVKVLAKERETQFRSAVETRAKEFAEEKQSLGRMVKTNVNRPKALLTVPVMATMEEEKTEGSSGDGDKEYVLEQRRNRVQLWKARVSIDKGYSAFLALTELRRLIQANATERELLNGLMGDVSSNVDLLHASLGVNTRTNPDGSRSILIDEGRLSSTLSLPKGRVLCARVIEGGILPHQSACEILPVAWHAIASKAPVSDADSGEDRLLRALTGLVLTVQPSVDPSILCRCLDATLAIGDDLSNITQSRVRMELLHSILSNGKTKCGQDSALDGVWKEKEKAFMAILSSQQK